MKQRILFLSLIVGTGLVIGSCADQSGGGGSAHSAATGPGGVGTSAETGASNVGGASVGGIGGGH